MFFVVYNIGSQISGSEVYDNTYGIYRNEESFLDSLLGFIEYVSTEGGEFHYSLKDPYNRGEYSKFLDRVEMRRQKPEVNPFPVSYSGLDLAFEVLFISNDLNSYINYLRGDVDRLCKDDFEGSSLELFVDEIETAKPKGSEEIFLIFDKYEIDINENVLSVERY